MAPEETTETVGPPMIPGVIADLDGLTHEEVLDAVVTQIDALRATGNPDAVFRIDSPTEADVASLRTTGVLEVEGVAELGVNPELERFEGDPISYVEVVPDAAGEDNDAVEAAARERDAEAAHEAAEKAEREAAEYAAKITEIIDRARGAVNEIGGIASNKRTHEQRNALIYIIRGLGRLDSGLTGKALADFTESEALIAEHDRKVEAAATEETRKADALAVDKAEVVARREAKAAEVAARREAVKAAE
jgi:hypothetical protein